MSRFLAISPTSACASRPSLREPTTFSCAQVWRPRSPAPRHCLLASARPSQPCSIKLDTFAPCTGSQARLVGASAVWGQREETPGILLSGEAVHVIGALYFDDRVRKVGPACYF